MAATITPTPAELPLRISEGFKNLGRVVNKQLRWPKLCERMSNAVRDNITVEQYDKLSQKERHERKNHGWFVGGTFRQGKRKLSNIESRCVLSFDLDELSLQLYEELIEPREGFLSNYEHFVYTTRSHKPETPRLRIVVPLSREITAHEFGPLTRIVAFNINPEMDQIDPVSYRITQLMFWPNVSKDGEFRCHWQRGKLLAPDDVLGTWTDDWRDYSRLPRSPREAAKIHEPGKKVQDPREKRGIIGAWCRAHTISDLIESRWPDRYAPGDATTDGTERYSYLPGSTTNGVLVYGDLLAWSHHSSDPIGIGRSINSWDFERINRFGDLDTKGDVEDFDSDPRNLPSFKAMEEYAKEDRDTIAELQRANYDLNAMADDLVTELEPDDFVEPPPGSKVEEADTTFDPKPTPEEAAEWMAGLELTKEGIVKSTVHSVVVILENDPRFKRAFAFNDFTGNPSLVRRVRSRSFKRDTGPIRDKLNGDPLIDVDVAITRSILEAPRGEGKRGWGLKVSATNMNEAVDIASKNNRFHPVQNYLRACVWDGVPRLRKMLHTYWHVADTTYHAEVSYNVMVGAVMRVMEPGAKFDFMPILEGPQGIGKSTSIPTLLSTPRWFTEFHMGGGKKEPREIVENVQGKWFVELPELAAFMDDRHSVENMKALFSGQTDRARSAYARRAADFPRQCIFWGTTNNRAYLRDETGNRRFWIIVLPNKMVDTNGIARDRDQLWAEAYRWYLCDREIYPDLTKPLPLFLSPEANAVAEHLQGMKMQLTEASVLKGVILEWLDTPVPVSQSKPGWQPTGEDDPPADDPCVLRHLVTVRDIKRHVLHEEKITSNAIGKIMHNLPGWTTAEKPVWAGKDGTQRAWRRTVAEDDPSDL